MRGRACLLGILCLLWLAACGSAAPAATHSSSASAPGLVLVAGATGSIGELVVARLLERGERVRGLTRKPQAARLQEPRVEWVEGDLRVRASLLGAVQGVQSIVFVAGSRSWEDPTNTPELVDYGGVAALAGLGLAAGAQQMLVVSSAGVTHEWPLASAHLQNVLRWKGKAEEYLRHSGLCYTILRPYGLDDSPAQLHGIELLQGDSAQVDGSISRGDLASVVVEALFAPGARNRTFELINTDGSALDDWKQALAQLAADPKPR